MVISVNPFSHGSKAEGNKKLQGSDLVRLLDMYERWQHNLFPSQSFDDFIAGVEKIGRSAQVKVTAARPEINLMHEDFFGAGLKKMHSVCMEG